MNRAEAQAVYSTVNTETLCAKFETARREVDVLTILFGDLLTLGLLIVAIIALLSKDNER
ncbi:hypothetical protein AGMMS49983_10430 [Clostridia bacterium]|nr:hypothetical protein AGMMS49983_10430 [Clostridia bacterium]